MPCYRIYEDRFDFLSVKPENASFLDYDFSNLPPKAKEVKIYYSILEDSLTNWLDSNIVLLSPAHNLEYLKTPVVQINFNEEGEVINLVFIKAQFYRIFHRTTLESKSSSHIYIVNEEIEATLSRVNSDFNSEKWELVYKQDTTHLKINKEQGAYRFVESKDQKGNRGKLNFRYNRALDYDNYSELIQSVILDKEQLKASESFKDKFVKSCQKDIYLNEGLLTSIFYMDGSKYSLINFIHSATGELSSLENGRFSNGKWEMSEKHDVEYLVHDEKGNWKLRTSLYNWGIGKDFRVIKYFR